MMAYALVAVLALPACIPRVNVSGCLADCGAAVRACSTAQACADDCVSEPQCCACASSQVTCVDEAFSCAAACAEEVEKELQ